MDNLSSVLQLYRHLANNARSLSSTSERRAFIAVLRAIGYTVSLGIGATFERLFSFNGAFVLSMLVSGSIILPGSLLIAYSLWRRLIRKCAYSGDNFDRLKYLEDDYHEEISEIMSLQISKPDKNRKLSARLERYMNDRHEISARVLMQHEAEPMLKSKAYDLQGSQEPGSQEPGTDNKVFDRAT